MEKLVRGQVGKKIIVLLVILLLFNFIMPKRSEAATFGGILFKPIFTFCNLVLVEVDITISMFLQGRQFTEEITDNIINVLKNLADKLDNGESASVDDDDAEVEYNGKNEKVGDFLIGPDTIFSGKVAVLDANIFDDVDEGKFTWDDVGFVDLSTQLRKTVAGIYVALRNIAAIVLLIALIYTGIKVLLSSNMPARKSEWVMMVQDWAIGLILLIFSHIIMITIFYISDTFVAAMSDWIGEESFVQEVIIKGFMSWDSAVQIVYLIMTAYLLYLTIVFAVSYFKRLFWICLLVIVAPIVSVMYALGKGTKDIYMNWLKEFMGAVFVQPFHILMYFVLISIPLGMVKTDGVVESLPFTAGFTAIPRLIYALLAMSMIKPFEKYLTNMFKMNRGIATVASREYGEKVIRTKIEEVKKKTEAVGKVAVTVGAAVATGGASLAATGAAGAAGATGATAGAAEAAGALEGTAETTAIGGGNSPLALPGFGPAGDSSLEEMSFNPKLNGEVNNPEIGADGPIPIEEDGIIEHPNSGDYGILDSFDLSDDQFSKGVNNENRKNGNQSTMMVDGLNNLLVGNANNALFAGNINGGLQDSEEDILSKEKKEEESTENDNADVIDFEKILSAQESKGKIREWVDNGRNIIDSPDLRNSFADAREASINSAELNYILPGGTAGTGGDLSVEKDKLKAYKDKTEKKKEKIDNNFVNNEKNINYVIEKYELMDKFRAQYPNKSEAYIQEKAKVEAKNKLKEMTPYAEKGFSDVQVISQFYDKQRESGMTPDEVVQSTFVGAIDEKMYNVFNKNEHVVTNVNNALGTSVTQVDEAIPNSREYWDAGFKRADSQIRIEQLAKEFRTTFNSTQEQARAMAQKKVRMESDKTTIAVPEKPKNRKETDTEKVQREISEWLNKGNRNLKSDQLAKDIAKQVKNSTDKVLDKIIDKQNPIN